MDTHVAPAKPGWKLAALATPVMLPAGWVPVTTSVTETAAGLPVAPAVAIEMVPVYVPAPKPAGDTDTVSVEGAVPEAGETVSQFALAVTLAVAVQLSAPLALFVI